jgi:RHS repeat-associated protein
VTDENEKVVGVYTDKAGKTIATNRDMGLSADLWTYFVYDDFGQLVFKISPKAFAKMDSASSYSFSWSSTNFNDLIYGYKYDAKGRLIEKKIPGKDVEYFVYDNLNRLILFQDGNMRQDTQWMVNRYDVLNRKVASAIESFSSAYSQSTMQSHVDSYYNLDSTNYEAFVGVDASHPHGYTNRTYPANIDSNDYLVINYFNDYVFDKNDDVEFTAEEEVSLSEYTDRTIGLNTGSKVRILNSSPVSWLLRATYYDGHQRPIQTKSENHIGGYDRTSLKRNFADWPTRAKHTHNDGSSSTIEMRYYSYDQSGRLEDLEYKIDEDVSFIMFTNKYNELGQVIEKNLHGDIDLLTYWQSIDYKYNIRGWLTNINHSNLSNKNSVINFNQYLNDNEIVDGMVYDTLKMSITVVDTANLSIIFDDSKYLMIVDPDSMSLNRNLQYDELDELEVSDRGQDEFDTYYEYDGDSFEFVFDSVHIYDTWQLSDIIDSLNAIVADQLPSQGVTDNTEIEHFQKAVSQFIADRVALVYFNDDADDLFGMDILYNEGLSDLDGDPQYNGLVSGIRWQAMYDGEIQGYGYEYDQAYRMTDANHGIYDEGWDTENRYGLSGITYDNNGNIMTLKRRGFKSYSAGTPTFGQIDRLTYAYEGTNQLNRVDDEKTDGISAAGNDFKDRGSEADDEYTYDNNGNLTADDNKQITSITYNHLNQPVQVTFDATHKIVYLYNAIGNKLRKTVYDGQDTTVTDYVANMIYIDDELEMVMTEEGRMVPQTSGYRAEYFLRDHLGNNRVSFTDTDDDGDADIIQEDHYYPYGMVMGDLSYVSGTKNDFMYQGKERQEELDLYWYDFGARMFDQQLGRWHVVDPMLQYNSPYVGMGNRPSSMIDPNGMWSIGGWFRNLFKSITWADGNPENDNYYADPNWAFEEGEAYVLGGRPTNEDFLMMLFGSSSTGGGSSGGSSSNGGSGGDSETYEDPTYYEINMDDLPIDLSKSNDPFDLLLSVIAFGLHEIAIDPENPIYMGDIFQEGTHLGEDFSSQESISNTLVKSEFWHNDDLVQVSMSWDRGVFDKITTFKPVNKPDWVGGEIAYYNIIWHGMVSEYNGVKATNINIRFKDRSTYIYIANFLNNYIH